MPISQKTMPNILITGTPGVGKSKLAQKVAEKSNLIWREVSKIAVENDCLDEYDEKLKCPTLNEDKLLDIMEEYMGKGGNIVDYHSADMFPERWFDAVYVLRTDNTILYDRLTARGYEGSKLENNLQCEIFQTLLEEAQSSYKEEIVHELQNNNMDELINNIDTIDEWIKQWKKDNKV